MNIIEVSNIKILHQYRVINSQSNLHPVLQPLYVTFVRSLTALERLTSPNRNSVLVGHAVVIVALFTPIWVGTEPFDGIICGPMRFRSQ